MLKDYPIFEESDFEYLRGKIQVLLPERDIFKKEDQDRFADLFRKLDAEMLHVPGGHVGFIVQSARYIDLMEKFLEKNIIKQTDSGLQLSDERVSRRLCNLQEVFCRLLFHCSVT